MSHCRALALVLPLVVALAAPSTAHAQGEEDDEPVRGKASISTGKTADAEMDEAPSARGPALRKWPVIETGAQAGFRTGFALGLGKFSAEADAENLSDNSRGYIPLWLDVGYRFHPNVYFGLYGQFGFMLLRRGGICEGEQTRCSGQDYRVGATLHYHFMPEDPVDFWIGLGAGYEWYRNSVAYAEAGVPNRSVTFRGPEWINAIIALDIKDSRQGGVGPFVSASFGQFTNTSASGLIVNGEVMDLSEGITSTEPHQWIMFGIQGSYFDDFL